MNCAEVEKHLSEYLDNETASDRDSRLLSIWKYVNLAGKNWQNCSPFLFPCPL